MSERNQDHELKDQQFLANYGVGLRFKDDQGYELESVAESPRKVFLKIHTWRGTSCGAMHWYARLEWRGQQFKVVSVPKGNPEKWKIGSIHSVGGYYDRHKPKEMMGGSVGITRPITAKDKRLDHGERFSNWEIGARTECLDTLEDAKLRAQAEFKRIFGPGWVLDESDLEGLEDDV